MNPKSYGKKCKCGHFESDHVNLNKKFYEPKVIPEIMFYLVFHSYQLTQMLYSGTDLDDHIASVAHWTNV
jgi:hypothetical protein